MSVTTRAQLAMGLATLGLVALGGSHRARAAGVVSTCDEGHLNTALSGGGLVTFTCGPATITVTATRTIQADTTVDGGGVITISGGNTVGVFSVNSGVKFTVQNLTIADGSVNNKGGGIYNDGTLTVTNSTFSGNGAIYGGGIYNDDTLAVTNSTFSGNSADYGGGIYNDYMATVTNSTFSDNSANSDGGAIYNDDTLAVTNCTFTGNSAPDGASGGAIYNDDTLTVTNSTFTGNSAPDGGSGGGIYNDDTLTVTNCTFTGNSAYSGGAIYNDDTATVTNTIIAGNSRVNCVDGGSITDGGHNIDGGPTCGFRGTGCADTSGTSFCNTDPELDPAGLANNGGPTQTIALCTGPGTPASCAGRSPAIDAGDNTTCSNPLVSGVDQRGFTRFPPGDPVCDIGAFEVQPSKAPSAAPAPALSPAGLVALGLLLSALGSRAVHRRA
jgi:predicted outer membrane repeat protein